jgi:tetratricopeptide (TPR) repeat protein
MKALVIAVLSIAAHAARADSHVQPVPQKARDLAERGRALHDAGDYADAIAAFKEAYVLAPMPGLLFNLAQAYRLAGQCDDAAWMYRRYLDSSPPPAQRALAETHLQTVEKCGHGGLRIAIVPPLLDAKVPEPEHAPTVVPPAASAVLSSAVPEPPAGSRERRIGLGLGIGGGVILAGAAYFAFDAHEASDQVTATYARGGQWSDVASVNARGQRSALVAEALGVAGGAAVITGAVFYAIGIRAERAQHLAVAPTTHGAEISMSWGF